MSHSRTRTLLATLAAATALAGCGGGGGGGGDDGPPPQALRVDVTPANAPIVTAQAIDAGRGDFFGDALGGVTGLQVRPAVRSETLPALLGDALRRVLDTQRGRVQAAGARVQPLATASERFACTAGGSVLVTVDVAVQGELSPGDRATLDFDACREDIAVLDGELSMRFVTVNSDLTRVVADATARALTARVGRFAQRADGSLRIETDESSATRAILRVTSDWFSLRRSVDGVTRTTRTLYDYDYRYEEILSSGRTSETFSYVASGQFPVLGEVSFAAATTAPIVTPGGAEFPSSGAATVTGRNGTTLDLVVVPTGVAWELDRGGDGSVEASGLRTWAQLEAEL